MDVNIRLLAPLDKTLDDRKGFGGGMFGEFGGVEFAEERKSFANDEKFK